MAGLGFKVDAAKALFFDRAAVTGAVDKATRKVLSRFGAFVRRRARSSIRKRKKVSQPGQPPSGRTGLLKRLLFFAFEPRRQSVVIGPAALNGGYGDGAEMLEHGGTTTRRLWVIEPEELAGAKRDAAGRLRTAAGKFVTGGGEVQFRSGRDAPRVTVRHRARPFMGPAMDAELPGLPGMWRDTVRD